MPLAKLESTLCHSGHAGARGKSFRHSVDEPFTLGFMKPPAAFVLIVLIVLLFVLVRSARVVPAGHVGVVDLFGKVRNEALPSRDGHPSSSEGLIVHLDVSISLSSRSG